MVCIDLETKSYTFHSLFPQFSQFKALQIPMPADTETAKINTQEKESVSVPLSCYCFFHCKSMVFAEVSAWHLNRSLLA